MYLKIKGQNVYFQTLGHGPNLIMLHGWKNDVSSFWGVAEELKNDFSLWLIDLPGFGRSDNPKKPFKVEDYAEIIHEFIEIQRLKEPMLLGHSVGGRIGIKLAAQNPKLLSKLVLEDAAGIKPKSSPAKPVMYVLAKLVKYGMPNLFNLKEKLRYRFYKSVNSDYNTAGPMKDTLTNLLEEDLTPDLKKITTPTLIVWGESDQTIGAAVKDGRAMYQMIPNSKFEIVPGAAHFPHLENPARFLYFVKDFLS